MRHKKGFTLLVAVVTTSLLLVVSFTIVNLAFRELVTANVNQESQFAFYNADSGIECATFWDLKQEPNIPNPFNPSTPIHVTGDINCNGAWIPLVKTSYVSGVSTSTFTVTLPKGCVYVEVVKSQVTDLTTVNSRGYNSCVVGTRRFQRGVSSTFPSNPPIPVDVEFTNNLGVSVSGNSLIKTAGDGWGNGGAASVGIINSGEGYVEFSVGEATTWRMAGLGNGDSNQSYTDIDFGIQPAGNGLIEIYENGTVRSYNVGTYVAGDVFKVAVESGIVNYYRNGELLYTSSVAPTYPLVFDAALYHNTSTIVDVKIASG